MGSVALAVLPYCSRFNSGADRGANGGWEMLVLALVVGLAFLHQAVRYRTTKVFGNLGATLLIVLYLGGLAQFFTRLRMDVGGESGAILLLYSVFVVKVTDIGAYFTGMATGRHKLIEWLSPKKTWEGFAGGIIVVDRVRDRRWLWPVRLRHAALAGRDSGAFHAAGFRSC